MTLTEFLMQRIAEDEAVARKCAEVYPPPWDVSDRGHSATVKADEPNFWVVAELEQNPDPNHSLGWLGGYLEHIARHDPARVLAECEAKRLIVARAQHIESMGDQSGSFTIADLEYDEHILPALAAMYADHKDYLPEWAP